MASNYTANYQLNQWEAGDQVLRTEFNADNAKIDAAIKAVEEKVPKVKTGWYRGNGQANQHIDIGFHPDVVIIYSNSHIGGSANSLYGGMSVSGANANAQLTIGSNTYTAFRILNDGFTVYETDTGDPAAAIHCNTQGIIYSYLAIKS